MSRLIPALPFIRDAPLPTPLELHLTIPNWAHNPLRLQQLFVFSVMTKGIFVLTVQSMSVLTANNVPWATPSIVALATTVLFADASAISCVSVRTGDAPSVMCCTRSARHGTLFPFPVLALILCLCANGRCHAVQARLCCKCCGHVIGLGPYLLSMTSSPFALVAVTGFSSFHFRFAPLISAPFAIRRW